MFPIQHGLKMAAAFLVAGCCTMFATAHATASIIELTGGDPGEGWTPSDNIVYAYNLLSGGTRTMQDVTFTILGSTAGNADLSFESGYWSTNGYVQGITLFGSTANDASLRLLLDGGFTAFQAPPITSTVTFNNLTPGADYQIDLFVGNHTQNNTTDSITTYNYSLNGGDYETYTGQKDHAYVISLFAAADASGQITLTELGGSSAANNPGICALAVAQIPEPATLSLLPLATVSLLRRRKQLT